MPALPDVELAGIAALHGAGDMAAALRQCRRLLATAPEKAGALHILALLRREAHDGGGAAQALRCAVALESGDPRLHGDLAIALSDMRRPREAARSFRRQLALEPASVSATMLLAQTFPSLGRDPVRLFARAGALSPNDPVAQLNSGITLRQDGSIDSARRPSRRALALDPARPEGHNNMAVIALKSSDPPGTRRWADRALAVYPGYPDARWNRAWAFLLDGDFGRAWGDFEARWSTTLAVSTDYPESRLWRGQSLAGKTLLLHAEQGLGDTLQFCRYVPILAGLGATVHLSCPKGLHRILARLPGLARLVGPGEGTSYDFHCPLLTVPARLGTSLASLPSSVPYLHAAPDAVERWRKRLYDGRPLVGLVWRGNPLQPDDRQRSLPSEALSPLLRHAGIRFVSLVKQPGFVRPDWPVFDAAPELADFTDTAALLSAMDLVVTSDTSVAHLAGALAKPALLMLCYAADWRWLLGRDDSPWYPTFRLLRQTVRDDWSDVIKRVSASLDDLQKARG